MISANKMIGYAIKVHKFLLPDIFEFVYTAGKLVLLVNFTIAQLQKGLKRVINNIVFTPEVSGPHLKSLWL